MTGVRALFAAFTAGLRVAVLVERMPFDGLVERLRQGRRFDARLADPELHLAVVDRWLRWLPPRRMGRCMKRSLILLHLWSRCGLDPRFNLGLRAGRDRAPHAWLTLDHPVAGYAETPRLDSLVEL